MSAVTSRGTPTAATSTSARRQTSARSRVREWHWVTVALAASSSAATGLPTSFERPSTTASAPVSSTPAERSSSMTPAGVHGTRPSRPCISRPALSGVRPSTSFSGSISWVIASPSIWSGTGSWSRMPLTPSSSFSAPSSSASSAWLVSAGSSWWTEVDAHLLRGLALVAHVDVRRRVVAHQHGGERRPHPGLRDQRLDVGRHALAHGSRHRLAVDDRALIASSAVRSRTSASSRRHRRRIVRRRCRPAPPRSPRRRRSSRAPRRRRSRTTRPHAARGASCGPSSHLVENAWRLARGAAPRGR